MSLYERILHYFKLRKARKLYFLSSMDIDYDTGRVFERGRELLHEALGICEEILRINKNSFRTKLLLGDIHLRLKNFSKAFHITTELLTKKPDNQKALLLLAALYTDSGNFDQAIACVEKLLEIDKTNINAIDMMISIQTHLGNKQETLKYLQMITSGPGRTNAPSYLIKAAENAERNIWGDSETLH